MSELAAMGVGVVVGGMVGASYTRTMDTGTAWEGLRRPEQLMMHNVLVRHFDTPRLANCLRVTVDTGTQMDALLAAKRVHCADSERFFSYTYVNKPFIFNDLPCFRPNLE